MNDYESFLNTKLAAAPAVGFDVAPEAINPAAFPFQRDIIGWLLRRGRAALFAGTGLGKSLKQIEFCRHVVGHTGGDALILAPLAVAPQTVREGEKFGVPVTICRKQADVRKGVNIANYEMLQHFDAAKFAGVALDEAGILKSFMGSTKRAICDAFRSTPYRLSCTATPAPNDHLELGNQAEFLGVMDSNEMISRWFINDTMNAGGYRLKGHAAADFWRWVATWAICLTKPSDLGYDDGAFQLPPLNQHLHVVEVDAVTGAAEGEMFRSGKLTATTLHQEMRLTSPQRAAKLAELIAAEPDEAWLVWCNTNYEAEDIRRAVSGVTEVRGSDKDHVKESRLMGFAGGEVKWLLTKPKIAGYGMNFQHCARVAFVGLSYSFEQTYQAIRRCWRFGQTRPVESHFIVASTEGNVLSAIREKQAEHEKMQAEMVKAMRQTTLSEMGRRRSLTTGGGEKSMAVPAWMRAA